MFYLFFFLNQNSSLAHKRIIHYTTFDPKKRANSAFLIAAYSVRIRFFCVR